MSRVFELWAEENTEAAHRWLWAALEARKANGRPDPPAPPPAQKPQPILDRLRADRLSGKIKTFPPASDKTPD